MSVELQEVADLVKIDVNDPRLPRVLARAISMVDSFLGSDGVRKCPPEERDGAILDLSSALWSRNKSSNGVLAWSPDGTSAIRESADLMISIRAQLKRYQSRKAMG